MQSNTNENLNIEDIRLILTKLAMQLETKNFSGAQALIAHCLERLRRGESLC